MILAIEEAKIAKANGDWPFGAVVVSDGQVVGKGGAENNSIGDVTAHAEMNAIRLACKTLGSNNLQNCTIYCTNEPCLMCAAAIFQAHVPRLFIGASRDDLSQLLRVRKIRIEDLAQDSGYKIEIVKGVLKDDILKQFEGIKK